VAGNPDRSPDDLTSTRPRSARKAAPTVVAISPTLVAGAAFVVVLAAWLGGGGSVSVPWAPTLGLRLEFALDGFGALYALLATGIGFLVFAYGAAYLPAHLEHERRPGTEARRFWAWMVVFMAAMVGLAMARDLILMFVFFDLTAVASYFLIGFDRHRAEARGAAFMALLVTGGSAVLMLLGAVLLNGEYATFSIPELVSRAAPTPTTTAAALLLAIAALAKSAQAPLHFWLPRAMEAPTPVSAYLHSAAMVAAGVLVIGRIHPLLALDPFVLNVLVIVGFVSIAVGGVLALAQDELKQVLAHSTISQYGYVVVLYGLGGADGAVAATLYVVAHAIAKSALFMTAGAITEATGESRLSRLGGLGGRMPVLAVASGIAAASLAALPLTLGFFKDELFFGTAARAGPLVAASAVVAAALTVGYLGRFWLGAFAGPGRAEPRPVAPLLIVPVAALAALSVAGGILVDPFLHLASSAAAVTHGAPVAASAGYHLDLREGNLMAVAAWALGAAILAARRIRAPVAAAVARAGDRFGPRRLYGLALAGLERLADAAHREEVRDLRTSLAAVLVPTGILAALGFLNTPTEDAYVVGPISVGDLPIIALLALAVTAALTAAGDRGRLRPVLALSVLGFSLAGVYAVMGAPDVALVAVVVDTVVTLVFVAVFSRLPGTTVGRAATARPAPHRLRNAAAGIVAGGAAFAVIWTVLSRPPLGPSDAAGQIRLTPEAHGGDVVTVILADFRGLDTMVEITVLAVAILGVASLIRRGDRR
jgi:multicomponent Na+:H+ antiporter subunit A